MRKLRDLRALIVIFVILPGVLIVVAQLSLPGPDIRSGQLETDIAGAYRAGITPHSDRRNWRVKSISCTPESDWDTRKWRCNTGIGATLQPDGTIRYRVSVDDNGCWRARAPKDANGVDSFLAFQQNERLRGCVTL